MRSKSKVSSASTRRARGRRRRRPVRRDGEIYGFLGPNGAGKSTMVKMLVTLLPPSGGRATVGGFDIATQGDQVRRIIGVALQEAALDPLLTGREHLYLQAGLNGFPQEGGEGARRGAARAGGALGRGRPEDRHVLGRDATAARSGARARPPPSIIFLDEPTTGLDPHSRTALWEEVRRLARDEGVTIFLTTQYLEEADVLAERVGIIDHGKIVAEGTPEELKAQIGGSDPRGRAGAARATSRGWRGRSLGSASSFPQRGRTAPSPSGSASSAEGPSRKSCARSTRRESRSRTSTLRQPTLDDVFLAKTGRPLEAGEGEEPEPAVEAAAAATDGRGARARRSPAGAGSRSSRPRC